MVNKKQSRTPRSKIAFKYGITTRDGSYKLYHKKRENAVSKANRSDLFLLTHFISRQCACDINQDSVAIANACKETLQLCELPLCETSLIRHLKCLTEAAVVVLSNRFVLTEIVERMLNVVMDTFTVLLQRHHKSPYTSSPPPLTPYLTATFVQLSSCSFLTIDQSEIGTYLASMLSVDTSKSLCTRSLVQNHFCVCLTDLLSHWITLIHTYVSRFDQNALPQTKTCLLGAILAFKQLPLLELVNSATW